MPRRLRMHMEQYIVMVSLQSHCLFTCPWKPGQHKGRAASTADLTVSRTVVRETQASKRPHEHHREGLLLECG